MIRFYRAIWAATWRQQLLLIALSVGLSVLAAAPLELQKDIINHVVGETDYRVLVWMCVGYLAVLALSAGVKWALEYRSATLGERSIRRIRGLIQSRSGTFAGTGPGGAGAGTKVTMISSEAEEVGRFAGEAIAMPLVRIGTLLTVLIFIFAQSLVLGAIVAAVVIPQGLIAVLAQPALNAHVRTRVKALRAGTDLLTTSAEPAGDALVAAEFDRIEGARRQVFWIKLSTKFAMNMLMGLGSAAILLIGGYYGMQGRIDVGTIVVALTGLQRAVQPWRELVMFYRRASMVLVRYGILVETFPAALEATRPEGDPGQAAARA